MSQSIGDGKKTINIDALKKITEAIAESKKVGIAGGDDISVPQPRIRKVQVVSPQISETAVVPISSAEELAVVPPAIIGDNMISLMGVVMPAQTLYLAIMFIIVGVCIWWFMCRCNKPVQKKEDDDE